MPTTAIRTTRVAPWLARGRPPHGMPPAARRWQARPRRAPARLRRARGGTAPRRPLSFAPRAARAPSPAPDAPRGERERLRCKQARRVYSQMPDQGFPLSDSRLHSPVGGAAPALPARRAGRQVSPRHGSGVLCVCVCLCVCACVCLVGGRRPAHCRRPPRKGVRVLGQKLRRADGVSLEVTNMAGGGPSGAPSGSVHRGAMRGHPAAGGAGSAARGAWGGRGGVGFGGAAAGSPPRHASRIAHRCRAADCGLPMQMPMPDADAGIRAIAADS